MVPRLIHPVTVIVEQIDAAAQTVDSVFREPVGAAPKRTLTLRGQVVTRRSQSLQPSAGGDNGTSNSDGRVVFETAELAAAGVSLHPGDVIVSEGGLAVRHRITRVEGHGTYDGVHRLLYAHFTRED